MYHALNVSTRDVPPWHLHRNQKFFRMFKSAAGRVPSVLYRDGHSEATGRMSVCRTHFLGTLLSRYKSLPSIQFVRMMPLWQLVEEHEFILTVSITLFYLSRFKQNVETVDLFTMKFCAFAVFLVVTTDAFQTQLSTRSPSTLGMSLENYSDELKETAARMIRPGYGLLACDESTGTVGARLEGIGLENNEENRRNVSSNCFLPACIASVRVNKERSQLFLCILNISCLQQLIIHSLFAVARASLHHS